MNIKVQMLSNVENSTWETICITEEKFLNNVMKAMVETYQAREFRAMDEKDNLVEFDLY